jgi:Flp pilus assembly protein TadD
MPTTTTTLKEALERGITLHESGKIEQAEKLFRQLISQYPTHPDVLNLLGVVLLKRKDRKQAADLFRQAIAVRADIAEFQVNLATALQGMKQYEDAERVARRAVELKPDYSKAWQLIGVALANLRRRPEAMECYRRVLELDPNDADAHTSLGVCYFDEAQYEKAMECQRQAVRVRPDFPAAHLNLALILLLQGEEEQGWEEYEWRSQCEGLPKHNFRQPLWDGSPLNGQRILLYTEQGLGDAIQFARFVPAVAERGGHTVMVCQKELKPLLATIAGQYEIHGRDEPLPKFDIYAPLLSLPRIFKLRTSDMRAQVPYLHAEEARVRRWKSRLSEDGPGFRVGIAWAGNPSHRRDAERSIDPALLKPLAQVPGVRLYSLQLGAAAKKIQPLQEDLKLIDHTSRLTDMAETAALVQNLDLVICVDTSVCHLAGALAKPVWVLIAAVPHWGWGLQGEHTPWYPTMRLFRQPTAGDWPGVIDQLTSELAQATAERKDKDDKSTCINNVTRNL